MVRNLMPNQLTID